MTLTPNVWNLDEYRQYMATGLEPTAHPPQAPRMPQDRSRYRSQLEARYAQELERLKHAGSIHAWWYEPITLRLAPRCTYTPDFLVDDPQWGLELLEVKGWWREDAKVKWKVAAAHCPYFHFAVVQWRKGAWLYTHGPFRPSI